MTDHIGNLAAQRGVASQLEKALRDGVNSKAIGEQQKQKAAEEFASLLFLEMIKAMRATIPSGGLFETDSLSQDVYMTLADVEVARAMVKREGIGLGNFIKRALDAYDQSATQPRVREALSSLGSSDAAPPTRAYAHPERADPAPVRSTDEAASHQDVRLAALPVSGNITSPYGVRQDPLGKGERFHKGVDIGAPAGSPVRAVAAGKVIFSGRAGGYGNLVAIDHGNGVTTRYAHNQTLLVAAGDTVFVGQEIAQVGSTGRSTAPHLHFEVIRDGQPIDPLSVVRGQSPTVNFASQGKDLLKAVH